MTAPTPKNRVFNSANGRMTVHDGTSGLFSHGAHIGGYTEGASCGVMASWKRRRKKGRAKRLGFQLRPVLEAIRPDVAAKLRPSQTATNGAPAHGAQEATR